MEYFILFLLLVLFAWCCICIGLLFGRYQGVRAAKQYYEYYYLLLPKDIETKWDL